jgi:hypothetical protein
LDSLRRHQIYNLYIHLNSLSGIPMHSSIYVLRLLQIPSTQHYLYIIFYWKILFFIATCLDSAEPSSGNIHMIFTKIIITYNGSVNRLSRK